MVRKVNSMKPNCRTIRAYVGRFHPAILIILFSATWGPGLHAGEMFDGKIWFTHPDHTTPVEITTRYLPSGSPDQPIWLYEQNRIKVMRLVNEFHAYSEIGGMTQAQNCAGLVIQNLYNTVLFTVSPDEFYTKIIQPWGEPIPAYRRERGDLIVFQNKLSGTVRHVAMFLTPDLLLSKDNHQPIYEIQFTRIIESNLPDPYITNPDFGYFIFRLDPRIVTLHVTPPETRLNCSISGGLGDYSDAELSELLLKTRNMLLSSSSPDAHARAECEKLINSIHTERGRRDLNNQWWRQQ